MRYLLGVVVPGVLQALLVLVLVQSNTGNGSWVGLGAFLIGLIAIPATAIVNVLYVRARGEQPLVAVIGRCFGIAAATPVLIIALLAIG